MARSVSLFTGQWADLSLTEMCQKAKSFGFDSLELACWGKHIDVAQYSDSNSYVQETLGVLKEHGLTCSAISTHLVGQAVCDRIDERHRDILPERIWADGDPQGVRKRAIEEVMQTAKVAKAFGVNTVVGFTGSPIWHLLYAFPPTPQSMIEKGYQEFAECWLPILDQYQKLGMRFALEVHPTEIAFDTVTAEKTLRAIDFHPAFGFNFDPSHLAYQGVDYVHFIHKFSDRIFHVHIKDVFVSQQPKGSGVFGGHLPFGDSRRLWDFRSPGRGSVRFEPIIRALNDIDYQGPLSVEWEDNGMDREHGAREACEFVRRLDFKPAGKQQFEEAFNQ